MGSLKPITIIINRKAFLTECVWGVCSVPTIFPQPSPEH